MRNVVCERNNRWLSNTSVTHGRTMARLGKPICSPFYLPSRSLSTHPGSLQGRLSSLCPGSIVPSIHKICISLEQEKEESINHWNTQDALWTFNSIKKEEVWEWRKKGPLKDSCWASDHHRSQLPNLTQKKKTCYYFVLTIHRLCTNQVSFLSHSTNRRPWHLWVPLVHCSAVQHCLIS